MNKIDWPPLIAGLDNMAMESLTQLLKMDNFTDLLINITLIGIIPGITEEFLFRGIIQKELKNVITNYHISVWLTAIFFGVMHFQIIGLFPKIIIGAVLGYAYHYSGSLLLPMLIHIFNNSFATVAYYFNPMSTIETGSYQEEISFLPVFLFTIMALIIFNYIHTQSKILQHANE
ncbi:MAG: CPBP family intramembrane glutamic endopeptidase [Saprospiraceae bacterium]